MRTAASPWTAPAGWDRLASGRASPFVTRAWLEAWWAAYGAGRPLVLAEPGPDGRPAAAALLARGAIGVAAPVNDHTGDWDLVGADAGARNALWGRIAALPAPVVTLGHLVDGPSAAAARRALEDAGRRVHVTPGPASPYLALPADAGDLLRGASRNLRSQLGRRRRALERRGRLALRTTTAGGTGLERDLEAFLRLEASGWKGRRGTAILADARAARLYRGFTRRAAEAGILRLHLLLLDGVPIAGDLGCAVGGTGFLLKTGFDEAHAALSPGLVLRGEVLRAAVEEGLEAYDFLGGPDPYKLRWASGVRPRVTLRGYRGAAGLAPEAYRRAVRPALRRGHALVRTAGA